MDRFTCGPITCKGKEGRERGQETESYRCKEGQMGKTSLERIDQCTKAT